MSKKIFIFQDGTGQNFTCPSLSNVAKLFKVIPGEEKKPTGNHDFIYKVDEKNNYHSFYHCGIGAEDMVFSKEQNKKLEKFGILEGLVAYFEKEFALVAEEVSGSSMAERIGLVLSDLTENNLWQENDEVYLVGFSRGAASVRIAARMLQSVLPKLTVNYLLVFDTVFSVQGPVKVQGQPDFEGFGDDTAGRNIKRVDHLIAGDEMRSSFPLQPFAKREGVRQILFSGSHSDVGGGADKNCLSDIALEFAIEEFRKEGIQLSAQEIVNLKIGSNCSADIGWDLLHGMLQTHFPRPLRDVDILIHKSVFERVRAQKSSPIALAELVSFDTKSKDVLVAKKDLIVEVPRPLEAREVKKISPTESPSDLQTL